MTTSHETKYERTPRCSTTCVWHGQKRVRRIDDTTFTPHFATFTQTELLGNQGALLECRWLSVRTQKGRELRVIPVLGRAERKAALAGTTHVAGTSDVS